MICDLHTHSVYSDGTLTPEEIVREAVRIGLSVVALTDHNTVEGLAEFTRCAQEQGVTALGGVELSTAFGRKEFHLLGYFIAPEQYDQVERLAKEFHVLKEISNIETVERLNAAGYEISYPEIRKKNPSGNVNRAHMAADLLAKGYVESISHAFATVLSDEAGFYVPPERLQLMDAIEFLQSIGAVSVLAHPLKDADEETLRALLPRAVEKGLMGLEVYHPSHSTADRALAAKLSEEFSLLVSGGSDFHGDNKPDIRLGVGRGDLAVPHTLYEALRQAHQKNT